MTYRNIAYPHNWLDHWMDTIPMSGSEAVLIDSAMEAKAHSCNSRCAYWVDSDISGCKWNDGEDCKYAMLRIIITGSRLAALARGEK